MELDYVKEPFRSRIKKVVETLKSRKLKLIKEEYFNWENQEVVGCCSVGFLALNYYKSERERDPSPADLVDSLLLDTNYSDRARPGVLIEYYQLRVDGSNPARIPIKLRNASVGLRYKIEEKYPAIKQADLSLIALNDSFFSSVDDLIDILESHPRAIIRETAFIDSVENLQTEDKPS